MPGLIHIYCGDGKGKTTAAAGLTLRAAGAGKQVLFTQFFKDGSSSEIAMLRTLPGIRLMYADTVAGLWKRMTPAQRQKAAEDYTRHFQKVCEAAAKADVLVLDEVLSACRHGAVPEEQVAAFLREKPETLEVVLTGRDPGETLLALADYVTEMRKIKHPYDRGIGARKGIEY